MIITRRSELDSELTILLKLLSFLSLEVGELRGESRSESWNSGYEFGLLTVNNKLKGLIKLYGDY